jgi:hypothetical protein
MIERAKGSVMTSFVRMLGAVTLGLVIATSYSANAQTANAQTVQHRVKHPIAAGHQIIVHPRDAYLTAGVGASVGSHNAYVYDTFKPPYRDTIQGTFVGLRGLDRLPNPYTVPGSDEPLFHVSLPLPGSNEPFISF